MENYGWAFDIKIGGKTQLIAKGEGKQNSHEELGNK
jgi:hypothetical protein